MLVWHKFDPVEQINLENVEDIKPQQILAKNMKLRFPNTRVVHNYGRGHPAGLEDPNYIGAYNLHSSLMEEN